MCARDQNEYFKVILGEHLYSETGGESLTEGRQIRWCKDEDPQLSGSRWCQDPKVNLRWGGLLSKDLLSGDLLQVTLADNTLLWGIAAVLEARPLLAGGQEMAL